jgi:hypothetical protein
MKIIFLLVVVVLTFPCFGAATIKLFGSVPNGITSVGLQKEYQRIRSIIQPGFKSDQKSIDIIYYSIREQKRLGVRLPEWGGGGAIGQDSIIIPIDKPFAFYPDDFLRITLHELVHIALARAYRNIRIPRWFHEGMAMSLSGELSFDEGVILSRALATSSLISLDSIEYVNRFSQPKAQVAYCQSHFAVQYLTKLYGYEMLPELLDSAIAIRQFDTACVKVFGLTVDEFETIVKNEMMLKYRYVFLFSDYSFFWLLAVVLAMIAFILTMFRNHKRRRILEEEESWYENPDTLEEKKDP